jgi:hypothetical protein
MDSSEHGNEISGFIEGRESLDKLSNYKLFKKGFPPCSE